MRRAGRAVRAGPPGHGSQRPRDRPRDWLASQMTAATPASTMSAHARCCSVASSADSSQANPAISPITESTMSSGMTQSFGFTLGVPGPAPCYGTSFSVQS